MTESHDRGKAAPDGVAETSGIELALLSSRVSGVVRAMMNTILRSSRSSVLALARDFSCCIVSADAQLVTAAESLPVHVMSGPDIMAAHMAETHPVLRAGDAFLNNSPYHGNSHAADHTILVPVVDADGVHRCTVVAKAHQADCGNSQPTTYMSSARDVYEEGALIFPSVQVQRDYEDIEDIIRMCEARIRVPEIWHGDYLALVGGARIGERMLEELAAEVGWDALCRFFDSWLDYSEKLMADHIAGLPAGSATATSTHDSIAPGAPEIPVNATVTVRADDAMIDVDFTDNVDCMPNGLNLTEATARSAALIGVFNSMHGSVPPNSGSFRRINISLRENCAIGIPRHPASCSLATTNLAERATNAVHQALAGVGEGIGLAEAGAVIPAAGSVVFGVRDGAPFVTQIVFAVTGGPASPYADGWLPFVMLANGGLGRRDSIEVDELRLPLMVYEQRIAPDTEGAGKYRGAPSARVVFGPIDIAMDAAYVSDGTVNAAKGVRAGGDGGRADQWVIRSGGERTEAPAFGSVHLEPGDRLVSISCGGGGYGHPFDREPVRVLEDVRRGFVSARRAQEVYGVMLAGDEIDDEATRVLRDSARAGAIGNHEAAGEVRG